MFPKHIKFFRIFLLFSGKETIYSRTKVFPSQDKSYLNDKFIENDAHQ